METNPENLPKDFKPDTVMKGQAGELIIAHCLRKDGYFVTCLSDIKGNGAPGMSDGAAYLALPDLQAAMKGRMGYCEVKSKASASFTVKTREFDHGLELHSWEHYQKVQSETGIPVYLFIYERDTGSVLYNHILHLDKVKRFTDRWPPNKTKKGGFFFPRKSFYKWGSVVLLGDEFYHQLDFFQLMSIKGEGDKLFGITRAPAHKRLVIYA